MSTVKTRFATCINPFTGEPVKQPPMPPGVLAVTNETMLARTQPGQFDDWFDTLKPGACLRTQLEKTESLMGYLRRYIKARGKKWKVRRSLTQPDGVGRIWITEAK